MELKIIMTAMKEYKLQFDFIVFVIIIKFCFFNKKNIKNYFKMHFFLN